MRDVPDEGCSCGYFEFNIARRITSPSRWGVVSSQPPHEVETVKAGWTRETLQGRVAHLIFQLEAKITTSAILLYFLAKNFITLLLGI